MCIRDRDKEKQSAQLQVVFPNLLEQAFSLNTKISYFGGQLWTGIEFTSADGTLTKKLELVSEPGAGQPNQVIFYAEGTEVQERVNYALIGLPGSGLGNQFQLLRERSV